MPTAKRSETEDDADPEEAPSASGGKNGGASQPSSPPTSPLTRSARDSSLRRLRSGTRLPEGTERPASAKSNSQGCEPTRGQNSAGRSRSQSGRLSAGAASTGGTAAAPVSTPDSTVLKPRQEQQPSQQLPVLQGVPTTTSASMSSVQPPALAQPAFPTPLTGTVVLPPRPSASSLQGWNIQQLKPGDSGQGMGQLSYTQQAHQPHAELPALASAFSAQQPSYLTESAALSTPPTREQNAVLQVQDNAQSLQAQLPQQVRQQAAAAPISSPRSSLRLSSRSSAKDSGQEGSLGSPQSPSRQTVTRRSSQAMLAVEEAGREAERWDAEERILAKARRIQKERQKKVVPPYPEPKRDKVHWDFLLEEMQWMAKEFAKERKWKLMQAKRLVKKAATSERNLVLRQAAREREEAHAIRRRASWIGKEVMKFWAKAERVVTYKVKSVAEARKKEIMDKHLSFLVDQTQRYSSLLAERLQAGQDATEAELQIKQELLKGVKAAEGQAAGAPELQSAIAAAANAAAAGAEAVTIAEAAADVQDPLRQPSVEGGSLEALPHAERPSQGQDTELDDEEDFHAEGEGDDADDEATLEEEEELAKEEEDDVANEIQDLADEAELPLEQLLARYGFVSRDAAEGFEGEQTAPGSPTAQSGQNTLDPGRATPTAEPAGGTAVSVAEAQPQPHVANELEELLEEAPDMPGDVEYQDTGDGEEDDEATLDQEDLLAARDGGDQKANQDAELAALNAEADMPLEELLAMYDMMRRDGGDDAETLDRMSEDEDAMTFDDDAGHRLEVEDRSWAVLLAGQAEAPAAPRRPALIEVVRPPETAITPPAAAAAKPKTSPRQATAKLAEPQAATTSTISAAGDLDTQLKQAAPDQLAAGNREGQAAGKSMSAVHVKDESRGLEETVPSKENLEDAAAMAAEAQPRGTTFETTNVHTKVPFLLKHTMREYQHIGLDWLMTIYTRRLNGILADEMGLGKTIQTIALLAYLACEKGIWGPHLIVVPTSVMLNWEMEFKKWCPAFKLLTYYGSAKERKLKRQGWSKPNVFHICITSYTLVLQDAKMFRRKKWKYLILDEAHMIKNWKSQRWQTLLNFNSARRLLITGTPLQNDLMELWSLMHFLMPQVFASHAQFKDWFSNPLTGMVDGSETVNKGLVDRLHSVLRPFLLRRLKSEVEKQMPGKHEHVVKCRLSKRQRTLYEDYIASSETRSTLSSGNFLGIINVLMQLRKVCNHPDLFEGRPIVSAFDLVGIDMHVPSLATKVLSKGIWRRINLSGFSLLPVELESMSQWEAAEIKVLAQPRHLIQELPAPGEPPLPEDLPFVGRPLQITLPFRASPQSLLIAEQLRQSVAQQQRHQADARAALNALLSERRCSQQPIFGRDAVRALTFLRPVDEVHLAAAHPGKRPDYPSALQQAVILPETRAEQLEEVLKTFVVVIPKARAPAPKVWCSRPDASAAEDARLMNDIGTREFLARSGCLRIAAIRQQLFFPDRRLVQFDCGKLQEMAKLLHKLKAGGHKALIFTQMAKMLDVLEVFLNLHGYTYLRLDGSTKPEQRQVLMQRFNTNPKIFVFILSTRSGGVGMNLTGADTVIFYDSDWNPAMDAQAQDRCHRIGQTREVHIYRLVSEKTIEENILTKSDQKRHLDHLAIQSGGFNTDFLQKFNPKDLLGIQGATSSKMSAEEMKAAMRSVEDANDAAAATAAEQETAAELAEFTAEPVPAGDNDDEDAEPGESRYADDPKASAPEAAPPAALNQDLAADTDIAKELGVELKGQEASQDALATLEHALRPVEKYAVRWLEQANENKIDVEAETAKVAQELDAQEWNMQEIERRQRQQEEEAEEEGEAQRMADWDRTAADAAYKAEVERALRQQQLLDEQAAALAESEFLFRTTETPGGSYYSGAKRGRQRGWSQDVDEAESAPKRAGFPQQSVVTKSGRSINRPARHGSDEDIELSSDDELPLRPAMKRPRTTTRQRSWLGRTWNASSLPNGVTDMPRGAPPRQQQQVWMPWEQAEDLVLCGVVAWAMPSPAPAAFTSPPPAETLQRPAGLAHLVASQGQQNQFAQASLPPRSSAGQQMPHSPVTLPLARMPSPRPSLGPQQTQTQAEIVSTTLPNLLPTVSSSSNAAAQPSPPLANVPASQGPTPRPMQPYSSASPGGVHQPCPPVSAARPPPGSWPQLAGQLPTSSAGRPLIASSFPSQPQPSAVPNGGFYTRPPQQPSNFQAILGAPGSGVQNAGVVLGQSVWERASSALAAGAAALTPAAAASAYQQGKRRTPEMCKARYKMLLSAGRGAGGNGQTDALGVPLLRAELASLVQARSTLKAQELTQLIRAAAAAVDGTLAAHAGLAPAVHAVLADFESLQKADRTAAAMLTSAGAGKEAAGIDLRVTTFEASQLLEVVKRACGPASRDLLYNLGLLLTTLSSRGIREANAAHVKQLQNPWQSTAQGNLAPPASLPRANLRPFPGTGPRPPSSYLPPRPPNAMQSPGGQVQVKQLQPSQAQGARPPALMSFSQQPAAPVLHPQVPMQMRPTTSSPSPALWPPGKSQGYVQQPGLQQQMIPGVWLVGQPAMLMPGAAPPGAYLPGYPGLGPAAASIPPGQPQASQQHPRPGNSGPLQSASQIRPPAPASSAAMNAGLHNWLQAQLALQATRALDPPVAAPHLPPASSQAGGVMQQLIASQVGQPLPTSAAPKSQALQQSHIQSSPAQPATAVQTAQAQEMGQQSEKVQAAQPSQQQNISTHPAPGQQSATPGQGSLPGALSPEKRAEKGAVAGGGKAAQQASPRSRTTRSRVGKKFM